MPSHSDYVAAASATKPSRGGIAKTSSERPCHLRRPQKEAVAQQQKGEGPRGRGQRRRAAAQHPEAQEHKNWLRQAESTLSLEARFTLVAELFQQKVKNCWKRQHQQTAEQSRREAKIIRQEV